MIWTVFLSLSRALYSCLSDKELRKLCSRPWLIAAISYLPLLIGAFYAHSPLVNYCTSPATGWLATLWFGLVWLGIWVLLLIACIVLSGSIVVIAAGSYHTSIARYVLTQEGVQPPPESEGINALTQTVVAEIQKLLVLIPLGILALFLGFIPAIGFIGLGLGLLLAGYQFLDYVLEALEIKVRQRFRFAVHHPLLLILMGIPTACIMGIPFVGLFLPPIAVCAAARILARQPAMLEELQLVTVHED